MRKVWEPLWHQGTLGSRGLGGINRVWFKGKICLNSGFIFAAEVSKELLSSSQTVNKVSKPYKGKALRCSVHERTFWLTGFENSPLLLCFISVEQLLKASVLEALEVSGWSSDCDHIVEGIWQNKITPVSARSQSSLSACTVDWHWISQRD